MGKKTTTQLILLKKDSSALTSSINVPRLNFLNLHRVFIEDEEREMIIALCNEFLDIDISQEIDFFNIGNLEKKYNGLWSYSYEGTKDEEEKSDKY